MHSFPFPQVIHFLTPVFATISLQPTTTNRLYPSCHWEDKAIRRLIGDGKLAARQKGTERRTEESDHECPICFLNYGQVNVTKCCQAVLCTECYLQVHPQREKAACPFCNNSKLAVSVKHGWTETELQQRTVEEERIRAQNDPERAIENVETQQQESIHGDNCPQPLAEEALDVSSAYSPTDAHASGMTAATDHNTFGSSLQQDSRFLLMKARSESISSEGWETPPLEALALSAEERRELEAEMQAQNKHPLALRLRMEEEERWIQNELEHHRSTVAQPRVLRLGVTPGPGRRDWNRILNALEQERSASDDVALLEAAMSLSMEERRSLGPNGLRSARVAPNDLFMSGLSEEEQLAMAIAASLQPAIEEHYHHRNEGNESMARENLDDETPGAMH